MSAVLTAERVTKNFGGLRALSNVSLEIGPGRVTAIIGPNGAGKSTFFNAVTGQVKVSEGKISLGSRNITNKAPHVIAANGLTRTFQVPRVFPSLTVVENTMLGARRVFGERTFQALLRRRRMRQTDAVLRRRALDHLAQMGLDCVADQGSDALGYAQRKLVEIARALTANFELLLLDEPFSGIHEEVASRIIEVVRELPKQGKGVCLIEHNMRIVMSMADYIYVLDHGELIAEGEPGSIRRNERVIEAYLGKGHGV